MLLSAKSRGVGDFAFVYNAWDCSVWFSIGRVRLGAGLSVLLLHSAAPLPRSPLDLQKDYAALTLGGSYEMFEDDSKIEDFINQLRAARPVVIETGCKLRGIL